MTDFWKKRPEYELVKSLIKTNNHIYLFGLPGIGKTHFLNTILDETNIRFIRLNGMTCQDKSGLLRTLGNKLEKEFGFSLPESVKMNSLIEHLTTMVEHLRHKGQFEFNVEQFYIVIDNAEKMNTLSPKYLASLFKIKYLLDINFSVILISSSYDERIDEFFFLREFELIPKICIKKPSIEELQSIIYGFIENNQDFVFLAAHPKKMTDFIMDIIHSFYYTIQQINQYITIIKNIYQVLIETKTIQVGSGILSNQYYKQLKRFYLDNPYSKATPDEILKRLEVASMDGLEFTLAEVSAIEVQKCDIQIAKIPAIILISCYLGNNNPERTDKKIFKDYKRRNRKTKAPKKEKRNFEPLKYNRLLAIAQSLISITFEDFSEIKLWDQSIDFYAQLNMLVQMGYLTKFNLHGNEFEKIKYSCNLDLDTISALCKVHNIRLQDYLFQDS